MKSEFHSMIDSFPELLEVLTNSIPRNKDNLDGLPKYGIYVFYESDKPLFVSRSKDMKNSIKKHSRPKADHNSAHLAFNIAKEDAEREGLLIEGRKRDELQNNPEFKKFFTQAKYRVSKMQIKHVEIKNQT